MSYLTIGSADAPKLISGKHTKGYADLWRKFLDENPPYYNSFASPIDALRTGAILEVPYFNSLPDDYFVQVKKHHDEFNAMTSSLDFSRLDKGKVIEFEELKTIHISDYIDLIVAMRKMSKDEQQETIRKKFRNNFIQIQFQLSCTGLDSAKLSFLSVESYDDEVNARRVITDDDVTKFDVFRDKEIITLIEERAQMFQQVKDHFK